VALQRTGGFHKYSDPGRLVAPENASSAMFIEERERFVTGVAAEEKTRREAERSKKAAELLRRREASAQREEDRWKRMEEEKLREEERVRQLQASGTKAKRNKGSVPFDLVTQEYAKTAAGNKLKYEDEMIRYRSAMRAQYLQEKTRGADFDLLTGTDRSLINLPARPTPLPADEEDDD
jgi:hypothetical protein